MEPNQFPVNPISLRIARYASLWEDPELMRKVEKRAGHTLVCRPSSVDHPGKLLMNIFEVAAGNGVFLSCKQRSSYVLPGTLLGLFPGVVFDPGYSTLSGQIRLGAEYPYLKRYDNYYIQHESVQLPYPVRPGVCMLLRSY